MFSGRRRSPAWTNCSPPTNPAPSAGSPRDSSTCPAGPISSPPPSAGTSPRAAPSCEFCRDFPSYASYASQEERKQLSVDSCETSIFFFLFFPRPGLVPPLHKNSEPFPVTRWQRGDQVNDQVCGPGISVHRQILFLLRAALINTTLS